jgi:hypothetical protein
VGDEDVAVASGPASTRTVRPSAVVVTGSEGSWVRSALFPPPSSAAQEEARARRRKAADARRRVTDARG